MITFDAPSREFCTVRRVRTNTPLQALTTLNDPVFFEAARALAARVDKEGGNDPAARVTRAFRLCVSRPPTQPERARILSFYQQEVEHYRHDPKAASAVLGGPSPPPTIVIVPYERLNQMLGNLNKAVLFFIRIDRSEYANYVIKAIDERFANSSFETITETEMGMAQQRLQQFRLLFVGVQVIAAIVTIVIGLVAANTAAMAVRERRNELAIMRAIGFTRRMLVGSIICEGVAIGVTAGAIGAGLAYVVMHYAGSNLLFAGRLVLQVTPSVAAGSIAVAAAIGFLSAAIPALTATRHDISVALRATV
jgi:ABC-type antimicrobial peptide transport system permease subunit